MIKLFYAPTSPYVRKVMVTAHVLGMADQIEKLPSAAHPVNRDEGIAAFNPLAKVPAAMTGDGMALYDSRVICEYLDSVYGTQQIFPADGTARWQALTRQSLGDGVLDAALLARYETVARPEIYQWPAWREAQLIKVEAGLASIEQFAPTLKVEAPEIGEIAFGCALGYLDFRFADLPWRERHPGAARWFERFNATPAMAATRPFDKA